MPPYKLSGHSWWRHQMETFSAWLAICAGNSPVPGEFSAQRPVTRSFDASASEFINDWVNNREASDLRRYCAHYAVIVMYCCYVCAGARTSAIIMMIGMDRSGRQRDDWPQQWSLFRKSQNFVYGKGFENNYRFFSGKHVWELLDFGGESAFTEEVLSHSYTYWSDFGPIDRRYVGHSP